VPGDPLGSPKACAARSAARRSGHSPLARRDLACHQKGAEEQQQRLFFIDEAGFYPLPSVVRTYAPVGHTPILRHWWTRDPLSAIRAIAPEGKRYVHCQGDALNSEHVGTFLEHLLREVPGRLVIIWDGSPIHRRHTIQGFLANGAAHRLSAIPVRASGTRSKASSSGSCAVSTSVISVMNSVPRCNAFAVSGASSTAVVQGPDCRSFHTGQSS
jgi:hypothetical protein